MTEHADHAPERVCYLLHFAAPIGIARHYLGIARADRLARRLHDHATGNGARLTRVAGERGIPIALVRLWRDSSYNIERKLKARGSLARLCPICTDPERPGDFGRAAVVLESREARPGWSSLSY